MVVALKAIMRKREFTGIPEAWKPGKDLRALMDEYSDVQLATLVDAPPEGDQWLHEIKFDGYRLLAFCSKGEVRLRTRNGNDWTAKFPSLVAALAELKAKSAVLDMEAVLLDGTGKSSFQALQHALGEGGHREAIQAYVFDLLHLNGEDLRRKPLIARKEMLEKLLKKSSHVRTLRYSDHVTGNGAAMLKQACSMGLEGVVSKLADSPYRAGREKNWLKSKCMQRQEFVIIGYTAARSGPRAIGALHLGYYQNGELKYAGKVGTGFGLEDARSLRDRLLKLSVKTPPVAGLPRSLLKSANWVSPKLLCEVSFTEWTEDGHIRHPSFQGLREDKKAQEVVMEKPVAVKKGLTEKKGVPGKKSTDHLDVSGISISHPDRVIFPDVGVTKGELAEYYAAASRWMLKDFSGHPLSLLRCPEGISGECFYQRNPGTGLGPHQAVSLETQGQILRVPVPRE